MTKLTRDQKLEIFHAKLTSVYYAGKKAWMKGNPVSPYAEGTLSNYVWDAGYAQDVRSMEELHTDWIVEAAL